MRFPLAWAEIAQQNSILKYSLLFSTLLAAVFAVATVALSLKEPLIIDRSCFSNSVTASNNEHTDQEVNSFLHIALEKRFSTESFSSTQAWLSVNEGVAKINERKELEQKNIHQKILINNINLQGNRATVEIDRVLAIEKLRTVIPATVSVQISSVPRTEINPYGLIVEKIELKKEEKPDVQIK